MIIEAETVEIELYHSYRHRWLGIAFANAVIAPDGSKLTNWIAHFAFRLMGPKVHVVDSKGKAKG